MQDTPPKELIKVEAVQHNNSYSLDELLLRASDDLNARVTGNNVKGFITKELISTFNKDNSEVRDKDEKTYRFFLHMATLIINLDDRLEQMEKRNNDELEIKTNKLTKLEKDLSENIENMKNTQVESTKKINDCIITLEKLCSKKIDGLEKKCKTLANQVKTLEQKIIETKHNSSMEIEELRKLESSFSELAVKDCFNELEGKFTQLSIQMQDDKIRQENIIKESQKKIEEYYNSTNRTIENTMKTSTLKPDSKAHNTLMDLERKLNELDKRTKKHMEDFQETINSTRLDMPLASKISQFSEELEKIKLDSSHRDGTLLGITDIINTKVINAIEKIDRMVNGTTNRMDNFFNNRDKNKFLKGEEQRGIGINIEPLEKILNAKRNKNLPNMETKYVPINEGSKRVAEELQEGKTKYDVHIEIKPDEDPSEFFRQIFVEKKGRKKVKLYISKVRRNSTEDENSKQNRSDSSMLIEVDEHKSIAGSEQGLREQPLSPKSTDA